MVWVQVNVNPFILNRIKWLGLVKREQKGIEKERSRERRIRAPPLKRLFDRYSKVFSEGRGT